MLFINIWSSQCVLICLLCVSHIGYAKEANHSTSDTGSASSSASTQSFQKNSHISELAARKKLSFRESAFMPKEGAWNIGLFNPLYWQVGKKIGLEVHPLRGYQRTGRSVMGKVSKLKRR